MENLSIGIIGAGISGLMAGLQLRRAGHEVTIFESRNRTGGRIQTVTVKDFIVETGPEFIHGHLRQTMLLLKHYEIDYQAAKGALYRSVKGKILESEDFFEHWEFMLKKMKNIKEDLSFYKFLDQHFSDEKFSALKQQATRYAEGFDLADVQEVSTLALFEEWQQEESDQYLIPKGYGSLIDAMEKEFRMLGGTILLEHPVRVLNWQLNNPEITLHDGRKFTRNKWILSLPISAFQHKLSSSETFTLEPVDPEKEGAFEKIGFGTVIKVVLIWDQLFWANSAPQAQFIFSDQFIPTWWTSYPKIQPTITGWLGGPIALRLAEMPDSYFLEKALESLSAIFSVSNSWLTEHLQDYRIFNWKNMAWSGGAYSYSKPGFREAKTKLRKPLVNRIYFTGEACYDGSFPGTVEAAIISGQTCAGQILNNE